MKNKDIVDRIPKDIKYYWKPSKLQSRREDIGWVHFSDLRKFLKTLQINTTPKNLKCDNWTRCGDWGKLERKGPLAFMTKKQIKRMKPHTVRVIAVWEEKD
jgi:hypothetical protein